MSPRTRGRTPIAGLAAEVDAFLAAEEAAAGDTARRRALLDRHADLFSTDAVARLREHASPSDADDPDELARRRRLLSVAVRGHLERATADVDARIAAAESSAVVVWRGERLAYREVPERAAARSDRLERNALEASHAQAVEAINPLRLERLDALQAAYRALGWDDLLAAARDTEGFDPLSLAVELQRFLSASETVYYAAQRRYLALIDIEQGDATDVDLRHLMRGAAWDHWFDARRAGRAAANALGRLGFESPTQVPGTGGWRAWSDALAAAARLVADAEADAAGAAAERRRADPSVSLGNGMLFAELIDEPAWVSEWSGMPEAELAGWLDFAGFRHLHRLRHETALLLYELRLYREPQTAVARAYYAGVVGLLTGVIMPEAGYLGPSAAPLASARQMRAAILASCLGDLLRRRHGPTWWRVADAAETLRRAWRRDAPWNAEAVVAHLGYDRYDWRPVLRQIRTRLIGEMSGYGGPNITTRAGTRKV